MNKVKVSIIMPSLNVGKYIEECLESALNQTLKDIEIICIDAGSTDGTWEYLKEMSKCDSRIKLIHSDIKSYGAQVNYGVKLAKGEYVAVLETDDYISCNMYEKLYDIAVKENVDYVKADFICFYTFKNGERITGEARLFNNNSNLYNRVINPHTLLDLYISDFNLWKGIYKKSFLTEKGILLNETYGAAYQDIGFMEQLLMCAERAYYTDDFLYYYRTDRDTASSYSVNSLKNAYVEFKRLYNDFEKKWNKVFEKGFFMHMAVSFCGEYRKTLIKTGYDCNAGECCEYYNWFKEKIQYALNENIIAITDFREDLQKTLKDILEDNKKYSETLKCQNSVLNRIEQLVKKDNVVIFGAGNWGLEVLKMFDRNDKLQNVMAFADNDTKKTGQSIAGIRIYSINKSMEMFPNAVYIVANEKYSNEIVNQLKTSGIEDDKIAVIFS